MGLLSLCLWRCLLTPHYQQQNSLSREYAQLRQQQLRLQHQLRHLAAPAPSSLPAKAAPLPVTDIAQTKGITLISWLPQQQPSASQQGATQPALSELVLLSDWQQLPPLFDLLATHHSFPYSFSLTAEQYAEQHQLKLRLYLETDDET